MVEGRSKQAFKAWLADRHEAWREAVEVVAMDGFTGFKTATTEELPDAVPVMDPFHLVRLAGDALDECRRRVQQAIHGNRAARATRSGTSSGAELARNAGSNSARKYLPGSVGGRRGVEHGLELIQHPVELLLGDDQRRCESNRDVVGLLRQHSALREALGGLPARQYRRIEVHPGPQPYGPNLGDPPAAYQGLQPAPEPLAQDPRTFLELPGLQEAYHRMTNRDRQRIAAEGRPVAARSDHAQNVISRHNGGHRHNPTTERLTQHVDVGSDVFAFAGECRPAPSQARLNLVGKEQHARVGTDLPYCR
jgi:hypothetical protein